MAATRKPTADPDADLVGLDGDGYLVAVAELLVDRPDLGPGVATRVAAGDRVPADLILYPRRAA